MKKINSNITPLEQINKINGIIDEIQPATSSSTGVVQPDNVSIVVEDGVISSLAGTLPDQTFSGTSIKAQSGVAITGLLGLLYPVGSLYITTQNTSSCPIAGLISGSRWSLVAQDRALWGGHGDDATHNLNAGLPNITGNFGSGCLLIDWQGSITGGALYRGNNGGGAQNSGGTDGGTNASINFDASRSNSIYGASSTVQPPAYRVNVWRRTS